MKEDLIYGAFWFGFWTLIIGVIYAVAMDTDQSRSRECSPLNSTICDRHPAPPPNPCGERR